MPSFVCSPDRFFHGLASLSVGLVAAEVLTSLRKGLHERILSSAIGLPRIHLAVFDSVEVCSGKKYA